MTIIRRGNSLFLRKRVPTRYRRIETRTIVHLSLHTDTGAIAAQKAPRVWSEMIEAWEAKLKGDTGGAEARFAAARELAHIRGVRYLSADAVSRLPIKDVLDGTEAVMRASKRGKIDHAEADTLLGVAPEPQITVTRALEEYWSIAADRRRGKSTDQIRRWENPRKKAVANFVKAMGDLPLAEIGPQQLRDFGSRKSRMTT